MSIGYHAELSESERKTYYPQIESNIVVIRCDDLSKVSGVVTFPNKESLPFKDFSFFVTREYGELEVIPPYKEGFIYNKRDNYVVMFRDQRILYLYGTLRKGGHCRVVPSMYTDLTKSQPLWPRKALSSNTVSLENYLFGCGCRTIKTKHNRPVITLYKKDCERCQQMKETT